MIWEVKAYGAVNHHGVLIMAEPLPTSDSAKRLDQACPRLEQMPTEEIKMARHTIDSAWTTIGAPGDALTIRNISTESVDLVFTTTVPSGDLGDPIDLWTLLPAEGANIRSNRTGLRLWARTSNGLSVKVDVFTSLNVVSGEGFYEIDPFADGLTVELLSGGVFDATTAARWTQSPSNMATITHAADGLTMTPATAAFDDRAQVFQAFFTVPNADYTVKVTADQVPTSDSCFVLIFDAVGGLTLIKSQPIVAAGEVTFNFIATSTGCAIYLRVHNTASPARFLSASIKAAVP